MTKTRPSLRDINELSRRLHRNRVSTVINHARLVPCSASKEVANIQEQNALCPRRDQGSWPMTNLTEAPVFCLPNASRGTPLCSSTRRQIEGPCDRAVPEIVHHGARAHYSILSDGNCWAQNACAANACSAQNTRRLMMNAHSRTTVTHVFVVHSDETRTAEHVILDNDPAS